MMAQVNLVNTNLRMDQTLAEFSNPTTKSVDSISFGPEDYFVLCAGFEDRVFTGLEKLELENGAGGNVIIIDYLPVIRENRIGEIQKICEKAHLSNIILNYDRQNPEGFGEKLLGKFKECKGRIFIDISGMSRILIVQILAEYGRALKGYSKISIIYTEAKFYPPKKDEVDDLVKKKLNDDWFPDAFISTGVFDLAIIPELTSLSMNGQPYRLIAFPSFNPNQLTILRSELQISNFTFIHGRPPYKELDWRTEAIRQINNIKDIPDKDEHYVSTFAYGETLDLLLKIYDDVNTFEKIFIAPTGSKMQAVAVGILRGYLSDIQIVYPTPKSFVDPKKYTEGVKGLFRLDLDSFPKQGHIED